MVVGERAFGSFTVWVGGCGGCHMVDGWVGWGALVVVGRVGVMGSPMVGWARCDGEPHGVVAVG